MGKLKKRKKRRFLGENKKPKKRFLQLCRDLRGRNEVAKMGWVLDRKDTSKQDSIGVWRSGVVVSRNGISSPSPWLCRIVFCSSWAQSMVGIVTLWPSEVRTLRSVGPQVEGVSKLILAAHYTYCVCLFLKLMYLQLTNWRTQIGVGSRA